MKKIFLLVILFATTITSWGQYLQNTTTQHYAIKASLLSGTVLNYGKYRDFSRGPVIGAELALEFYPRGKWAWEQRWGFPTFGVALMGAHLGNIEQMGITVAAYPYMTWSIARSRFFDFGIKTGLGFAFLSNGGYGIDENGNKTCMRGYVAGIANVAFEGKIKIDDISTISIEGGGKWINNGEFLLPNYTTNIYYGSIGYQHRLTYGYYHAPRPRFRDESLQQQFAVNVMLAGGGKGYQFTDKSLAPVGTFHAGIQFKGTNVYMTGVGFDIFYNGIYIKQGKRGNYDYNDHVTYSSYFIENNNFANKMRVGVAWGNSFIIGRVSLLADIGIYLYDPVKDFYASLNGEKRGMFYSFDPQTQDGWLYLRAGVRCRIYDNLFAQVSMKTHLLRIDHFEFGLGYSIPFRKKLNMNRYKAEFQEWEVIHPDRDVRYNEVNFNYRRSSKPLQQKIRK